MKKIIPLILLVMLAFTAVASADVWVDGHYRGGKWVDGHYRSDPDGNRDNNWSRDGNTNPHTGKPGRR